MGMDIDLTLAEAQLIRDCDPRASSAPTVAVRD